MLDYPDPWPQLRGRGTIPADDVVLAFDRRANRASLERLLREQRDEGRHKSLVAKVRP